MFLRKERGNLKSVKFKIQEAQFNLELEKVQLKNKIKAQQFEIESFIKQKEITADLVKDYTIMLNSEERLFSFGESSIFLMNSRENNLISSALSLITIENRFYISITDLFKIMANPD